MLGNEHKLSWVSKHVGAKSNRPLLAALLIAVFFVLTRRRPDEDEGSGVVDTARDVRKVAEMVRRSKDSSRLLVGSYLSYQSALPYNRPTTQPRTHSPTHPLTRSPAHPLTRSPAHPLNHSPAHPPLFLFVLFLQDSATASAWKALADKQRSLLFPCSEHSNETYSLANPISSFSSSDALWSMMSSVRVVVVMHLARASHSLRPSRLSIISIISIVYHRLSSSRCRKHQSRAKWRPSQ